MRRLALIALGAAALAGCGTDERAQPSEVKGDPGLRVFSANGCGSCHTLSAAGTSGTIGPNLDNALRNRPREQIRDRIVNPPTGSVMPEDYGTRLSDAELDQLVDFLARAVG